MKMEEAIRIWETVPYMRAYGFTHRDGDTFCAVGILLKTQGFKPVDAEAGVWIGPHGGSPFSCNGLSSALRSLQLPKTFLAKAMVLSDQHGKLGPEIAKQLKPLISRLNRKKT